MWLFLAENIVKKHRFMSVLYILVACVTLSLFTDCLGDEDGGSEVDDAAISWADAYFNFDLKKAQRYTTPESRIWLSFLASNITENDLTIIRQQEESAIVELTSSEQINDSTWLTTMTVSNFMMMDSIGQTGHMVDEAEFTVPVVKRNKRTFVRMEGLPRSGRQSHD